MHEKLPPGITLIQADDFQTWLMDIQVMDDNPLYQGETYRLKFSFTSQYPIEVCLPFLSYYFAHHRPIPHSDLLTLSIILLRHIPFAPSITKNTTNATWYPRPPK
jgi:ubiquitin-conjugating enzyme E2 W